MIRTLQITDYNRWLELAGEVEPLFGSMVNSSDFQEGIKNCIENSNAYGVETDGGCLAGIIAIDRKNNEILWLAVDKKFRGKGNAFQLVKKAIKEMEDNGDIFVQTFAKGIDEGIGARILYERNGFVDLRNAGKNPAGIDTVIMVRKDN